MSHDAREFMAWAHGPGVEAGFDGIAGRHEALVGRVRSGGLDGLPGEEAARAVFDCLESWMTFHACQKAHWQANGESPEMERWERFFALDAELHGDPAFERLARRAAECASSRDAPYFASLISRLEEGADRDSAIADLETALGRCISDSPKILDPPEDGDTICPEPARHPRCLRRAARYRALARSDCAERALALLRARADFAEARSFPSFAHLHLSRRKPSDPRLLMELLREEAYAVLARLGPAYDGLPCALPLRVPEAAEPGSELDFALVLEGFLRAAGQFLGLAFQPREDIPLWNETVRAFELLDLEEPADASAPLRGVARGIIIFDLVDRARKSRGTGMDYLRYPSEDGRGWIVYVTSTYEAKVRNPAAFLGMLAHEFGHCLETLLHGALRPALLDVVPPEGRECVSELFQLICAEPAFLDAFVGELVSSGGPLLDAKALGVALREEELESSYRVAIGGMEDLAVHLLSSKELSVARAREEAEAVMTIKRGRLCPDAWIDALRAVGHGDYACNSYCYTFGAILARRIVTAAGGEGCLSREAIRSICRALKQGLADARGPFDLAGCFDIVLLPATA